jgi:hypothetical protein
LAGIECSRRQALPHDLHEQVIFGAIAEVVFGVWSRFGASRYPPAENTHCY